jgi:hypothetical protein
MLPAFPGHFLTFNTRRQCTATSLAESHVVRDKTVAVTRPIYKPLNPEYDHRCLYRSVHYLGLRPAVSCEGT